MDRVSSLARVGIVVVVSSFPSIGVAQEFRPVGGEFQINTYTFSNQTPFDVGLAASGAFVVTWEDDGGLDGDTNGIFARRFNSAGTPQASAFQVNTTTVSYQRRPRLAVKDDGAFVVVWTNGYLSDEVRARVFNSAGVAQTGEVVVASDYFYADVAMDGAGDFIVVWQSPENQDGSKAGVFGRRFDASGAPSGLEFQVNTFTMDDQRQPAVAMSPAGAFVVTWRSTGQDGDAYGVFARRFDSSGAAQATEFAVNLFTSSDQEHPAAAMGSQGNFIVAWDSFQDGSYRGIFARRFDSAGVSVGSEFQVNAFTINVQFTPQVAMNSDSFFLTWGSAGQDGDVNGVFGRRFAADGTALGTEFGVNTTTSGPQGVSSIAVNEAGHAVATWASVGQDGSGNAAIGQRYLSLAVLDVDGNGSSDPLTDGLLVLRYLFGFRGATLINGAVGPNCLRCDSPSIEAYLAARV